LAKTARIDPDDYVGEFRVEVGTKYYVADGVRVAKKVGDEWITLVPGWLVEEGVGPFGAVTTVTYEGE
jgi:hypothetical protein